MSLIKSISGIRGTMGGLPDQGLTPTDVVRFTSGYSAWLRRGLQGARGKVVVGRDARTSGPMVRDLVVGTLQGMGLDVIDIGLAATPTTEVAVINEKASGGIIITASHNPRQWNALKLLNDQGEFLTAADGAEVLRLADQGDIEAALVDQIGHVTTRDDYDDIHIDKVLALPLVDAGAVAGAHLSVAFDAVNSVGGVVLPKLLRRLGVARVEALNAEPTGRFAHNPEPLPQHLADIANLVRDKRCDIGFVVDPDVDRLAMICPDGSMFGEEYTVVSCADYVLSHTPGDTVSNLSSSRALRDVTERHGGHYTAAAVGEVNVVAQMRSTGAVIGGEGNGGVIYPACHSGRDALVGIALMLTQMATSGKSALQLRASYPSYFMSKNRVDLAPGTNVDALLASVARNHEDEHPCLLDGVKIDYADSWVHMRKSNTEPIVRIYSEAPTQSSADALARRLGEELSAL